MNPGDVEGHWNPVFSDMQEIGDCSVPVRLNLRGPKIRMQRAAFLCGTVGNFLLFVFSGNRPDMLIVEVDC